MEDFYVAGTMPHTTGSTDFVVGTRVPNGLLQVITAADNQRKGECHLGYSYLGGLPKGLAFG